MTKISLTFVLMLYSAWPCGAQTHSTPSTKERQSSLRIFITDPQDAVVPNAAVWLLGRPGPSHITVAITNEEGECTFNRLSEETYTIVASFPGFKITKMSKIHVAKDSAANNVTVVLHPDSDDRRTNNEK
jgi:hypothetical protein